MADPENGTKETRVTRIARMVLRLPRHVARLPVLLYRYTLSPLLGPRCRYQPTCSAYALDALERHGVLKGGVLAVLRIGSCHPVPWLGSGSGFDPVPETVSWKGILRSRAKRGRLSSGA